MIIEQHYDDEVLIGLLNEAEEDAHVPACDTCTDTLQSYRDLSAALHDDSVWENRELSETPAPQTTNFLRAFAERTKAEDLAAGPIVAKLLADPSAIDQHPEWRTAGVVRGLLKAVDERSFSDPQLNLSLARAAVRISESLPPTATSTRLNAKAWHELGYALYAADLYVDSLKAYERAEELFIDAGVAEYDLANVGLHRAQVYGNLERIDEAIACVRESRRVFISYGAHRRVSVAEATEAALLYRVGRLEEAAQVFQRIAADSSLDDAARALGWHNSAECLGQLRRFSEAKIACGRALAEFDRLRLSTMRSRARWVLARILIAEKSCEQALPILEIARREFEESALHQEVALISIDTAEAMWTLGRAQEVVRHCQLSMEYFAKACLTYTQGALTALAYLKEAAEANTLNPMKVERVRQFFEVLPKQPHLLFALPV